MHFTSFQHYQKTTSMTSTFWWMLSVKITQQKCGKFWSSTESRHSTTWTKHCHSPLQRSQLARRAYRNDLHLLEQIVVTSFNEVLNNSTFNWELRKLKRESTDHALTKPLQFQAYLDLESRNPIVTACGSFGGVKNMTYSFLQKALFF